MQKQYQESKGEQHTHKNIVIDLQKDKEEAKNKEDKYANEITYLIELLAVQTKKSSEFEALKNQHEKTIDTMAAEAKKA